MLNVSVYWGLVSSSNSTFTNYFNILNIFFSAFVVFFISGVFYIRGVAKYSQYLKIDNIFSLNIVLLISLFAVFFFLEFCCNMPSFLLLQQAKQFFTNNIADSVFLLLFLLITPVTFILLVRNENLSVFFCILNFTFLFFIVLFLTNTTNIVGLVMGYELLFVPAFFIMRKTVYSSSAQSAYSVFTV